MFNDEIIKEDFSFTLKTNVKFGIGMSKTLGDILIEKGYKRFGLIIDMGVYGTDIAKEVVANLTDRSEILKIIESGASEPDYDFLDECRDKLADNELDCIIGIGGGSTMDTAKGMAVLLNNPGKAISYRGFGKVKNPALPIVLLPTTAGTGSEVTPYAVFIDKDEKKKLGINTDYNYAELAILDPLLTLSCPRGVTIGSAMDAMVHTIESYVAKNATPISRIIAMKAFSLLYNSIEDATNDLNNVDLRSKLLLGSYLAGASLMNSGAGPAGAMSYPLGVDFNVPHGHAGAVFLSKVINFNIEKGTEIYAPLYDLINGADAQLTPKEKNLKFGERMEELSRNLGIPEKLGVYGVKESDIETLVDETFGGLKAAIDQNPITFTEEDLRNILVSMM
ncbi:iron-containing alcohol dehydrogenase [Methanococcoides sp. SA1]|nr:iron-containing alcohol dehydrogenase [Methanococcoides sp. SA1]